ncbi:MAG TPA: hypothetical protein VNY73_06500, partial [Bacteroidia bacterium]|nr:hypothetical protein [Bacteroidia bacterium]
FFMLPVLFMVALRIVNARYEKYLVGWITVVPLLSQRDPFGAELRVIMLLLLLLCRPSGAWY